MLKRQKKINGNFAKCYKDCLEHASHWDLTFWGETRWLVLCDFMHSHLERQKFHEHYF